MIEGIVLLPVSHLPAPLQRRTRYYRPVSPRDLLGPESPSLTRMAAPTIALLLHLRT